jgi:hypothetical protein
MPVLANEIPDYLAALQAAGRTNHADFAIGLVNFDPQTNAYYNGLLCSAIQVEAGTTSGTWCRSVNIFRCPASCATGCA